MYLTVFLSLKYHVMGGVSINKEKVSDTDMVVNTSHLLDEKYLLVQRGKKNYYLIIVK